MKRLLATFVFTLGFILLYGQEPDNCYYDKAYNELTAMLEGKTPLSFKRAVFVTENAYNNEELDYQKYCQFITRYAYFCQLLSQQWDIQYKDKDSIRAAKQAAVYTFITDTIPILQEDSSIFYRPPFTYNFDDYAGEKNWESMFVTMSMGTKKGNCHSLPMLYKIILEEMGEPAWLAVAPNHFYIKTYNKYAGWHNIELTGGSFPTDAWIITSGYVHLDAIRSGIYMDTLSQQQSVAVCLVDLAMGHERKFGIKDTAFILKCCRTALEYYPNYINALLLQAETLYAAYRETATPQEQKNITIQKLTGLYAHIHTLGYRKKPKEMYLNWLLSMNAENRDGWYKRIVIYDNNPKP